MWANIGTSALFNRKSINSNNENSYFRKIVSGITIQIDILRIKLYEPANGIFVFNKILSPVLTFFSLIFSRSSLLSDLVKSST